MAASFMSVSRDYPACIALYANPDGFVGAILLASSLDGRRSRMDHRAAKLIEIRCRKDASILYRLKPLFYLIWALLALARTGHFSPIVREPQVFLTPFPVIRPVDVRAYIWDGHYESQSGEQRPCVEGVFSLFHKPTGRTADDGGEPVFVIAAI